ncbi:MAG: hypothetical protein WAR79_14850 [Melioribacteraceae bacterium]
MKELVLISSIFISILLSSCKSEAVQIVEDFLVEKNLQSKLNYVRKGSKYLQVNTLEDLAKELPNRYLDIRSSKEIVDENEIIVEVVTKKIALGAFSTVDQTFTFFVYKNNEEYKIDLDATFAKPDTTLNTMIQKRISFSKVLRTYVTESSVTEKGYYINKNKALMSISDQETRKNFSIVNDNLYKELKNIFSKTEFAHLIISVSYIPENDYLIVADSVIQKGWIIE